MHEKGLLPAKEVDDDKYRLGDFIDTIAQKNSELFLGMTGERMILTIFMINDLITTRHILLCGRRNFSLHKEVSKIL